MFEVARVLARRQDLDRMLCDLMGSLVAGWEAADAGVLMLYDSSDERLEVVAAEGYHQSVVRGIRLAPGEATCGKAYQTGEASLYDTAEDVASARKDLTQSNRERFEAAHLGPRRAQSAICVPLATDGSRIGVLMLESRRASCAFLPFDIGFMAAVCNLIALAYDNARLRLELRTTQSLEEANQFKAELLSMLAHEMRTPLTAIKGYSTALLMDEVHFAPDTQAEFLQIIDRECDVLQDLIHDFLESAIVDAGLLVLEPEPVRLPRLVKRVTDELSSMAAGYRFLLDFPANFPIIDADTRRIEQVLRNLLDNAIKYTTTTGLVVVRGEVLDHEVRISVSDQGVGIAPEHLNRLFDKFFRIKSPGGHHVVGTGLGLPLARTIVEAHGGSIWAESKLEEGSTFFFTLPLGGADDSWEGGV